MLEEINKLKKELNDSLLSIRSSLDLNELRINYLGKKSKIQEFSNMMQDLSIEKKKELGRFMNEFKAYTEEKLSKMKEELEKKELEEKLNKEKIDVTLPATKIKVGGVHPITKVINEVEGDMMF